MRNSRWIAQRAESLSHVFMTRDPRVTVLSQDNSDTGLDLMIRVGTTPRQVDWIADVAVKGVEQPPPLQHCLKLTDRQIAALEASRHPAFLLVVDVRSELLYSAWIRRPVVETGDDKIPACVCLEPLDNVSFKIQIDQIRSYYKKLATASSVA